MLFSRRFLPGLGQAWLPGLCMLFALQGTALAAENSKPPSPDTIPGTTRVSAEEVIDLVNTSRDLVMIDSRIRSDRKQGYIEGSVSLPDIDTTCDSLAKLIPEKSRPVLFYCNGVKCGRSAKAIVVAKQCGYNKLYWYRGGFEDWLEKGYPIIKE